ncbi:MAG: heme NO-binding domain-containing protein [Opitutales bacterium]|jgi:hypothetical protein
MYGMVNKAIEEMVTRHHGESTWAQIKAKAGVDVEVFMSNEGYSDDITYNLVGAASEVLGVDAETILIGFGEHWVLHTAQEAYGSMMQAAGRTLPEFLTNLPNFHMHVAMVFPNLQPPRFECADITDRSLRLHYYSHRPGLAPFVVGLMQGLGKMYETPATVQQVVFKDQGADHDEFDVTWSPLESGDEC